MFGKILIQAFLKNLAQVVGVFPNIGTTKKMCGYLSAGDGVLFYDPDNTGEITKKLQAANLQQSTNIVATRPIIHGCL